jgi:hypothetical protein
LAAEPESARILYGVRADDDVHRFELRDEIRVIWADGALFRIVEIRAKICVGRTPFVEFAGDFRNLFVAVALHAKLSFLSVVQISYRTAQGDQPKDDRKRPVHFAILGKEIDRLAVWGSQRRAGRLHDVPVARGDLLVDESGEDRLLLACGQHRMAPRTPEPVDFDGDPVPQQAGAIRVSNFQAQIEPAR